MTVADYLVDASALARVLLRQNTAEWDDRIAAGLVAICDLADLEVLYSARSATDRTPVGEHRSETGIGELFALITTLTDH